MTTTERIVWGIAAIVFAPALLAGGGFIVALGAVAIVLTGYYGGRYGARVYEQRNIGAKGGRDLNQIIGGDGNDSRRKR